MRVLNEMLEEYVPVPRAMSLPKLTLQTQQLNMDDLENQEDLEILMGKYAHEQIHHYEYNL